MALSGSCVVKATSQNNLIFSWAAAQDIAGNRSKVTWQMLLEAGQYGRIVATPGSPWEVTIADTVFSGTTSLAIENNETKVLASGELWLEHDSLGARSFDFSFRQEFWIKFDGESIRVISGSGSAVLDDIPRASQPTMPASAVLGQAVTIATNGVSSFTHTLEYSFGNASGVIAQGVGAEVAWMPPLELARQIPNDTSAVATITCTTFAGGKSVGSRQTTILLQVPDSVRPTAQADWEDVSGAYHTMGTLVQNISRLSVSVQGTGAYGSTITGASVTLSGKAYGGGYLTDSGELSLEVSVTDSRGRVGSKAYPISVATYAAPTVKLDASRCDQSGNGDDSGSYARISVSGFITRVGGKNNGTLDLNWGSAESIPLEAGSYHYEKIVYADPDATLAISATVTDKLTAAGASMNLSTGYATLDLLAGGKGIAFGKAATQEGFECAMPAYFTGGINGFVEDSEHPGCYYRMVGGEKEWIEPPMAVGVEYRTTKRYDGSPVYTKLVHFGPLPNNTFKILEVSGENISILDVRGICHVPNYGTVTLPYDDTGKMLHVYGDKNRLAVTTYYNRSTWDTYVTICYCKNYGKEA